MKTKLDNITDDILKKSKLFVGIEDDIKTKEKKENTKEELKTFKKALVESESEIIQKIPKLTIDELFYEENEQVSNNNTICFKTNPSLKEISKLLIKIRYNTGECYFKYNMDIAETTSDLIRDLIIEEWERKKHLLLNLKDRIKPKRTRPKLKKEDAK